MFQKIIPVIMGWSSKIFSIGCKSLEALKYGPLPKTFYICWDETYSNKEANFYSNDCNLQFKYFITQRSNLSFTIFGTHFFISLAYKLVPIIPILFLVCFSTIESLTTRRAASSTRTSTNCARALSIICLPVNQTRPRTLTRSSTTFRIQHHFTPPTRTSYHRGWIRWIKITRTIFLGSWGHWRIASRRASNGTRTLYWACWRRRR